MACLVIMKKSKSKMEPQSYHVYVDNNKTPKDEINRILQSITHVGVLDTFFTFNCSLTLSCPGTGRAIVKIGHSNLRPGNKKLSGFLICVYKHDKVSLFFLQFMKYSILNTIQFDMQV